MKRPANYQELLNVFHRRAGDNKELILTEQDFDIVLDELLTIQKGYDLQPINDLLHEAINKLNRLT